MNYSTKVTKYFDGMQLYETLIEDEQAIYLIFALGFEITINAILKQIDEYIEDMKNGTLQEIPDYDVAKVTILRNYFRTGKLKYDMEVLKGKPVMEHLQNLLGSGILEGTSVDLCEDIEAKTRLLVEKLKQIDTAMHEAVPAIFEANICKLLDRYDWSETEKEYQTEKNEHGEIWMDWLLEKQEQELQRVLQKGIMDNAKKPSATHLENVDYPYHRGLLSCDFEDNIEYKKAYAKIMQYATRKDKLLLLDFKNYGKYIAMNFYKFRPEQKIALFEIIKKLEMIQKDMVRLEPELGEYLGYPDPDLETLDDTDFYAPARFLTEMLQGDWIENFRTSAKYNKQWCKDFITQLMKSEHNSQIACEWKRKSSRFAMKASIIACMKEAGVIRGSDLSIASAIIQDKKESSRFARYMGRGKEKPYLEWIINYVIQE